MNQFIEELSLLEIQTDSSQAKRTDLKICSQVLLKLPTMLLALTCVGPLNVSFKTLLETFRKSESYIKN